MAKDNKTNVCRLLDKAKIPYVLEAKNPPEKVQIIKQISSLKRGTKRELVDKEIYFRIGV